MSYESNPYYSPQNVGAELVAEFEVTEPDYSFDSIIVLRKISDGTLWIAHDSGCSCPTPFEDHTFTSSFMPVRRIEDADAFVRPHLERGYGTINSPQDFYNSVREALR